MAFNDLFKVYPNKNVELRPTAKMCYEFGATIAQSQSGAHSNGLDEHTMKRQRSYVEKVKNRVEALNNSPLPDLPATHPIQLPIDMSEPYEFFTTDVSGNPVPINEETQLIAEYWMIVAAELAGSQSAALGGSIVEFDFERTMNNIAVIDKLLDDMENSVFVDVPETAEPGAPLQVRGGGTNR